MYARSSVARPHEVLHGEKDRTWLVSVLLRRGHIHWDPALLLRVHDEWGREMEKEREVAVAGGGE
jgi:hypothetical protein